MSTSVPQPTVGRVVSILWFPFFLAVVMSLLFVAPLARPVPQGMRIGVVGDTEAVATLQKAFDDVQAGGFTVVQVGRADASEAVSDNQIAAAIITGEDPVSLLASAASATRAEFLEKTLPTVVDFPIRDIAPSAVGDATGTGVFFYALPMAIVAMVSAIVLLQLGAWSYRRKMIAVTVIGAFTAVVTFLIALWQQLLVLSASSLTLVIGTFVFVLGISWTLTGAAVFLRQFLVPAALTFVLVLGVPTAGAPVSSDMIPSVLSWLHEVMPMGQFIALVRSMAYGVGSPFHPAIVLLAWLALGARLMASAGQRSNAYRQRVMTSSATDVSRIHTVAGTVLSLSGAAVFGADVWVLDGAGGSVLRTKTDAYGHYSIAEVTEGVHHVLVTADHAEPEIVSIGVHGTATSRHDFVVHLWDDPAANLAADEVGER